MPSWIPYDIETTPFPIENLPWGELCVLAALPCRSHIWYLLDQCIRLVSLSLTAFLTTPLFPSLLHNAPTRISGAFRLASGETHVGVAIGNDVMDVTVLAQHGLFDGIESLHSGRVFDNSVLNSFMDCGPNAWHEARMLLTQWLSAGDATIRDNPGLRSTSVIPQSSVVMQLPTQVGDYTGFYASRDHASNVGTMLRGKENALQPNWRHLPVAYHGRASSVIVSGTPLRRPNGQIRPDESLPPIHGPCRWLDFELELGYFVGVGNNLGDPIDVRTAENHLFGVVLMNDWSARDIQKWEYVPLGPFNAKNLGTSISPWVVTMEALAPFKVPTEVQEPAVLPYLDDPDKTAFDVKLQVDIIPNACTPSSSSSTSAQSSSTDVMTGESQTAVAQTVCRSNAKYMYWSPRQMIAHHTSTGCPMRPGDLFGSGTISGPEESEFGSMIELSWKGSKPVSMSDGSKRTFLNDGDNVVISGWCESASGARLGFGTCEGVILPAHPLVHTLE